MKSNYSINISLLLLLSSACTAFQTGNIATFARCNRHNHAPSTISSTHSFNKATKSCLLSSNNNDDNENGNESITSRFLNPKIDDKGLPIADALISQIVAPTFQVFWLSLTHSPIPSWLSSTSRNAGFLFTSSAQGSLVAPTLIHGAGLAVCWTMGALAAKGYDSDAFNISGGRGYGTVISRIIQAGAFASGLLIFSTQVDLFLEFGRAVQLGESTETDLRLVRAAVELVNDIFFEALIVGSWRLYRASLTGNADGRPPNYEP